MSFARRVESSRTTCSPKSFRLILHLQIFIWLKYEIMRPLLLFCCKSWTCERDLHQDGRAASHEGGGQQRRWPGGAGRSSAANSVKIAAHSAPGLAGPVGVENVLAYWRYSRDITRLAFLRRYREQMRHQLGTIRSTRNGRFEILSKWIPVARMHWRWCERADQQSTASAA